MRRDLEIELEVCVVEGERLVEAPEGHWKHLIFTLRRQGKGSRVLSRRGTRSDLEGPLWLLC